MSTPAPVTEAELSHDRTNWLRVAKERDEIKAERDQLRAELANQTVRFHDEIVRRQGTVRANQELDLKELNHFRDLLAAERARLDHFLRWDPTFNSREDIYRDMQEAAK